MKPKFVILYFMLALGFSQSVIAGYSSRFQPDIGDDIVLDFENADGTKLKNEISNLSKIAGNMRQSEKKNYKVKIQSAKLNKEDCEASVKINGDWKDHLDAKLEIASLNVNLLNDCYIGGINKFKLLLPHTRNDENEIFWAMLLNHFGFPTLYTKKVNVKIGNLGYKAIFQEKPTSFFLERNGLREAPIIEQDERNFWNSYADWFQEVFERGAKTYPDVFQPLGVRIKGDLITPGDVDGTYGKLVNKEFINKDSNIPVVMMALNEYLNPERHILNKEFYDQLIARFAPHGFGSQTYVYQPGINSFIPIYYDGNVNTFKEAACDIEEEIKIPDSFATEYKSRTGTDLDNSMICVFGKAKKMSVSSHWPDSEDFAYYIPIKYKNSGHGSLNTGFKGVKNPYIYMKNGLYYEVDPNISSETEINLKRLRKALSGNLTKYVGKINVPVVVIGKIDSISKTEKVIINNDEPFETVVDGSVLYVISQKTTGKKITVNLVGEDSRVVFIGEYGNNHIYINGSSKNTLQDSRHDNLMWTGCATFYNTRFDGTSLNSSAIGCEDSINLLNATGNISAISIVNASEDGLDADFSNVSISNIFVNEAGNDCIDYSTGNYISEKIRLSNCKDKAISVGENARFSVRDLFINKSTSGLVVKDGSKVIVDKINALNVQGDCTTTQRKKQRYDAPKITVFNSKCISR